MKLITKISIGLLAALVIIQFISLREARPNNNNSKSIFEMNPPPAADVENILNKACLDCHSYQTKYPWYAQIAPVSWYIDDHVNNGRKHLNFDEWSSYSAKKADHKLEECIGEVKEGEMPLEEYVDLHPEAELTKDEMFALLDWFIELRRQYKK